MQSENSAETILNATSENLPLSSFGSVKAKFWLSCSYLMTNLGL